MNSRVIEIFEDDALKERIKNKLPPLFSIAWLESSGAGKIGMEVGSAQEGFYEIY
ncbi:MAG: ThaI family type II restriction endonuclease [Nitrospinota bacterium]